MAYNQDATITLSVIAKDLASGNIGKAIAGIDAMAKKGGIVGSVFQGMGQSFGQMLNPLGLMQKGIGAVTDFLQAGISSAIEEEQSLARLDQALANNVDGWNGNRDAIDAAIEKRMELGFSDDVLRDSMGKLVTATGDVNRSLELQGLAADIARGRNIDLATATDIVVKAQAGNVRALKAMGIELEKGASKTEILAELQRRFGGQAEAFADTTAGAMATAQIAIDEVAEDIGEQLTPMIRDLAVMVRDDVIPAVRDLGTHLGNLGSHIDNLDTIMRLLRGETDAGAAKDLTTRVEELAASLDIDPQVIYDWAQAHQNITDVTAGLNAFEEEFRNNQRETATLAARGIEVAVAAAERQAASEAAKLSQIGSFMASEISDRYAASLEEDTKNATAEAMSGIADTISGNKDVVGNAMDDFLSVITNPMKRVKEIARVEGELTSERLQEGLESNDPGIRAAALDYQRILLEQYRRLTGQAYTAGVSVANQLENGLGTFRFSIRVGGGRDGQRDQVTGPNTSGYRHSGGRVWRGVPVVVGEHRPEVFTPETNGYVSPSIGAATQRGGGAGGVSVSLSFPGVIVAPNVAQMQELARAVAPELAREFRRVGVL